VFCAAFYGFLEDPNRGIVARQNARYHANPPHAHQ